MKKLALSAIAIMAGGFGINSVASEIANSNIQKTVRYDQRNQNRETQPLTTLRNHSKQKVKSERSYSPKFTFNEGISPKTYGMHYVKPKTHKRTNV